MAHVLFDLRQMNGEILAAEAYRVAGRAGARRPTDPVNIILRILREIVIEYVADVRDV